VSLKSEIAALRAEIDARARGTAAELGSSTSSPRVEEQRAGNKHDLHDVDALLKMLNDTLDEFAEELDKYPRLTALTALGVGLALGVVLSRRLR
jgi:hypothetical protein